MIRYILTILILGQILMGAKIDNIEINGVKIPVIFEQDKRLPIANTQIVFTDSGSIADIKKAGLAKFSAKMLNEGTKKFGSNDFALKLESQAIHISASTGTETFVFEVSSLKDKYATSMKYLKMLLSDPNYTDEAFQKVQTMSIGALSQKEDDFDYIASINLRKLLFDKTVLAQPSNGTIDSVKSITLEDVKDFVKSHLVLSRAIIVVGGDLELKDVKKELKKTLNVLQKGKSSKVPYFQASSTSKEVVVKKDTKQAYIYFGSPYNMRVSDEEYFKARVAIFILGSGGFGSRLMEDIRVKRGLAYSAYARLNIKKSSSYMSGYLQTKLESLDEAKQRVQEVIENFVKDGVTQDELEQTKRFLLGSEPLRVETMSQRLNRTFMEYYNGHKLGASKEELEKIKALKLDELNSFIKKHKEILNLSFSVVTK